MNLKKLTNREKGIICYLDQSVAIVNWTNCGENTIPIKSKYGDTILCISDQTESFDVVQEQHFDDMADAFLSVCTVNKTQKKRNYLIACEDGGEFVKLCSSCVGGMMYRLRNGMLIIVPDAWP